MSKKIVWDSIKKRYVKSKVKPVKWIQKNNYEILEDGTIKKGTNKPYKRGDHN